MTLESCARAADIRKQVQLMLYVFSGFLRILGEVGKKKKRRRFSFLGFCLSLSLSLALSNDDQFKVFCPFSFYFCCMHTEVYLLYHTFRIQGSTP